MIFDYKSSNFISIPTTEDKRIYIYDKNKNLIYSIDPFVSFFYLLNNCIIIKITNENDIKLTFETKDDAIIAFNKLIEVKDYFIFRSGTSGSSGASGSSGISGTSGSSGISGTSGITGSSGTSGISVPFITSLNFEIKNIRVNQTYTLDLFAPYDYMISGLTYRTDNGNVIFDILYDQTGITNLIDLTGTTSRQTIYATGNNNISEGGEVDLYIKDLLSSTILDGSLKIITS